MDILAKTFSIVSIEYPSRSIHLVNNIINPSIKDTYVVEGDKVTISYPNGKDDETFYIAIDGDIIKMAYVTQPDVIYIYERQ